MPLVYRFCRRRGLQDADARDITQQVLSIVHRTIGKFDYDPSRGRFRNWLGAVTSHEIWRHVKQSRRRSQPFRQTTDCEVATLSGAPVDPAWYEEFNGYIFERALARIRSEFEADAWVAFDLTWLRDMKPREAAEHLGKPAAWVYKARYKILERLREELEFLTSDAAVFHQPS
jgi:RNA polymerase sigma-70 factor (ECF subfamily)